MKSFGLASGQSDLVDEDDELELELGVEEEDELSLFFDDLELEDELDFEAVESAFADAL